MDAPVAVVLAAGQGTRMKSDLPKVLFEVCGKSMVEWVLDALDKAGVAKAIVVVGYKSELVRERLADRENVEFAEQTERLGTGHAVQMCRENLADHDGPVLVLTGDSPLIQTTSIRSLLDDFNANQPACLLGTLNHENPAGLGRIVRDAAGDFLRIVEDKDATDEQKQICEVNMSTYLFNNKDLLESLDQLTDENKQREYYLTDCPGILKSAGRDVRALPVLQQCESLSVNTVDELALVEEQMRQLGYQS